MADRVVFHGELHGEALDRVAARCDIGVGGLGLHRKGQYRSMTLKLREYMARGLPFVYAVDDPSLPEDPAVCLRLANDESPIDLAELAAFARRAQADEETPARMRAYAESHMSWRGVLARCWKGWESNARNADLPEQLRHFGGWPSEPLHDAGIALADGPF